MNLYECKIARGSIKRKLCFSENPIELKDYLGKAGYSLLSFKKKNNILKNQQEKFTIPFFKCLYSLINNKVELVTSLNIVSSSFKEEKYKAIVDYIIEKIYEGYSFSKAISKLDLYFDLITIKTIEISEKTARLDKAIFSIIDYLEEKNSSKKEIMNSLRYPIILSSILFLVILFWVFFIVPVFTDLFNGIDIKIPAITKYLVSFRNFCINNLFLMSCSILLFIIFLLSKGKSIISNIGLIKKLRRDPSFLKFFSSMSLMIKENINLIEALQYAKQISKIKEIANIDELIKQKGDTLANSMRKCKAFTESEISIVESGEKSGNLWQAFKTISEMLNSNIKQRTKKIISLAQPVMILIIGIMMIIVVYSVFVPMYSKLSDFV